MKKFKNFKKELEALTSWPEEREKLEDKSEEIQAE